MLWRIRRKPHKSDKFPREGGKTWGGKGILIQDEHVGSMTSQNVQSVFAYGIDQQGGKGNANYTEDVAPTILSDSHGTPHGVCAVHAVDCRNGTEDDSINGTLQAKSNGGTSVNLNNIVRMSIDVYNQTIGGDVAETVTAAVGGANTSGPKILEQRKEENEDDSG